jgi:nitroreductase
MLLAARGLGLGTTLTTRHLFYEKEIDQILGIPPNAEFFAIIPIGYPVGRVGPLSRLPLEEVTFADTWGKPWK